MVSCIVGIVVPCLKATVTLTPCLKDDLRPLRHETVAAPELLGELSTDQPVGKSDRASALVISCDLTDAPDAVPLTARTPNISDATNVTLPSLVMCRSYLLMCSCWCRCGDVE